MKDRKVYVVKWVLTVLFALVIGAVLILMIHENPIDAYVALVRGAFGGNLKLGTTLSNFTPLLLTSAAFAIAAKGGAFNVGVEGEVFLGGLAAAYVGIYWTWCPKPLLIVLCFAAAILVSAAWAFIAAFLKVKWGVNEVCVTILMNSVAQYIASYCVSGPMSAGKANSQSPDTLVTLPKIMKPSTLNTGIFIAIVVFILVWFMLQKTTLGYKIRSTGTNPAHAEYAGMKPGRITIIAMMISGALGGIAGCIQVLGAYGYYLDNFATGLGSNGMLIALIARSNFAALPFVSFFVAVLKSGAMGMQQSTGVPKSIVDTLTAVFICVACMEMLFIFKKKKKSGKSEVKQGGES
ncbi:MAG: ABC transporter permease [Clostridiales bacterium]|nr:ABC transporter permease [Clostridiales bacterium]